MTTRRIRVLSTRGYFTSAPTIRKELERNKNIECFYQG